LRATLSVSGRSAASDEPRQAATWPTSRSKSAANPDAAAARRALVRSRSAAATWPSQRYCIEARTASRTTRTPAATSESREFSDGGGTSGHGSGGGGFRGRRGGGGFGGRHGRPAEGSGESADLSQDPRAFDLLSIVHHDPELKITDGLGREHVLYTDGRKIEEERSAGTMKIRAKWKDGRVVVATTPDHGPKITETYAVTADGSSMTVTTKIEG